MKNKQNLDEIPLLKMSKPIRELYARSRGMEITGAPPIEIKEESNKFYRLLDRSLSTLRNKQKKTLFMLADELGISGRKLLDLEKHESKLTVEQLNRYVQACGGKLKIHVELENGKKHKFLWWIKAQTSLRIWLGEINHPLNKMTFSRLRGSEYTDTNTA